jgi:hypothetical protein
MRFCLVVSHTRQERDMSNVHGLLFQLLVYFSVLGIVGVGGGVGIATVIGSPEEPPQYQRAKSILDERIATARQIKEILARPQEANEPLPPITAKLVNPKTSQVAIHSPPERPKRLRVRLSPEARNAMAMENHLASGRSYTSTAVDRGSIGGW